MVCLGLDPRAAGWKAQTNPLNYGGYGINLNGIILYGIGTNSPTGVLRCKITLF